MDNPIETVCAMLSKTPGRWLELTQALPEEQLTRRPAPGEWSAVECLQHIVDSERVYQFRLACFRDGIDFPNFDPQQDGAPASGSAQALAAALATLRAEGLRTLARIGEDDLERRVRHAELGPVTLREMLNNWAAHDLNHTMQAERALMQPYLLECGPWIRFYGEHRVSEKLFEEWNI